MARMLRVSTRLRGVAITLLLGVLALGCRADLVAPIEVAADGSATAGLSVRFDARMLAELDALGVDPTAELGAAAAGDARWSLERTRDEDGGLTVSVTRSLEEAGEVRTVYRELVAGLAPDDPAMVLDLDVQVEPNGASAVAGTALLRPPRTSGIEVNGIPVGDDQSALSALVAEHVTAAVELRLPGPVDTHDGVRLDRTTIRFDLEPGVTRSLSAVGGPPSWWARLGLDTITILLLAGAAVVLVGAGLLVAGRRRVTRAG